MSRRGEQHKSLCKYPGCDNQIKSRGYCNGHYQQMRSGRALTPLAAKHRRYGPLCSVHGCGYAHSAKGLCDGHYQQMRAGKPISPLRETFAVCQIKGCTAPHEAKGFCLHHYGKYQDHGSPFGGRQPCQIDRRGTMLLIHLSGERGAGKKALVDLDMEDIVRDGAWWLTYDGYVARKLHGHVQRLHHLVLPPTGDLQVDHINGNLLDNRRENLRLVTFPEQMQNKSNWGKSGHRGVFWEEDKQLWRVLVRKDKKLHSGGRHKKLEDAVATAKALREKLFTHHNEERHPAPVALDAQTPPLAADEDAVGK